MPGSPAQTSSTWVVSPWPTEARGSSLGSLWIQDPQSCCPHKAQSCLPFQNPQGFCAGCLHTHILSLESSLGSHVLPQQRLALNPSASSPGTEPVTEGTVAISIPPPAPLVPVLNSELFFSHRFYTQCPNFSLF